MLKAFETLVHFFVLKPCLPSQVWFMHSVEVTCSFLLWGCFHLLFPTGKDYPSRLISLEMLRKTQKKKTIRKLGNNLLCSELRRRGSSGALDQRPAAWRVTLRLSKETLFGLLPTTPPPQKEIPSFRVEQPKGLVCFVMFVFSPAQSTSVLRSPLFEDTATCNPQGQEGQRDS